MSLLYNVHACLFHSFKELVVDDVVNCKKTKEKSQENDQQNTNYN